MFNYRKFSESNGSWIANYQLETLFKINVFAFELGAELFSERALISIINELDRCAPVTMMTEIEKKLFDDFFKDRWWNVRDLWAFVGVIIKVNFSCSWSHSHAYLALFSTYLPETNLAQTWTKVISPRVATNELMLVIREMFAQKSIKFRKLRNSFCVRSSRSLSVGGRKIQFQRKCSYKLLSLCSSIISVSSENFQFQIETYFPVPFQLFSLCRHRCLSFRFNSYQPFFFFNSRLEWSEQ